MKIDLSVCIMPGCDSDFHNNFVKTPKTLCQKILYIEPLHHRLLKGSLYCSQAVSVCML